MIDTVARADLFDDKLGRGCDLPRRKIIINPDMGVWRYYYDTNGNLVKQSGGGGNLITGDGYYREYDGQGQLIRVRNGSSSTSPVLENYSYDPSGQRVKIWRNNGQADALARFWAKKRSEKGGGK